QGLDAGQPGYVPQIYQDGRRQAATQSGQQCVATRQHSAAWMLLQQRGRFSQRCWRSVLELWEDHAAALALCIKRQIRSGVIGISTWWMPRSDSASATALLMAAAAPTVPTSPAPLAP